MARRFQQAAILQIVKLLVAVFDRRFTCWDVLAAVSLLTIILVVLALIREILHGDRNYWD